MNYIKKKWCVLTLFCGLGDITTSCYVIKCCLDADYDFKEAIHHNKMGRSTHDTTSLPLYTSTSYWGKTGVPEGSRPTINFSYIIYLNFFTQFTIKYIYPRYHKPVRFYTVTLFPTRQYLSHSNTISYQNITALRSMKCCIGTAYVTHVGYI